jgi:transcriptional regulator with PAS, ATPase and Fis domain
MEVTRATPGKGSLVSTQITTPVANDHHGESLERLLHRKVLANTPCLVPLVERLALAAAHDVTVLLNGETGTGKTFMARLIHDHSPRMDQRFVAVACGAISSNLIESEFFGHAKGAFTGADQAKVGKFAVADKGTLLLDEVDTFSLEQQATLLRVIETGEFEPVGSTVTQKSRARLIVASNIDLKEAVEQGKFRSDLYYRLNVMSFYLPPLRHRVPDIALLAETMLDRFARKFGKASLKVTHEAQAALESYAWPGNIRQLENVIQNAVLVSTGPELLLRHLPQDIQNYAPASRTQTNGRGSLHHQRDLRETEIIQKALADNSNSRSRAAEALGISRVALYKKLKKFGLKEFGQTASKMEPAESP